MTETENILLVDADRSIAGVPERADHAPAGRAFGGAVGLSTLACASLALVRADMRYWTTVAPIVRAELARWEQAARAIPDPALRALALGKLRDERFNAQVAATLATLAPRSQRARVVEAIVALQVLYDYVDVLGEQPADGRVGSNSNGRALLAALPDAVLLDLRSHPTLPCDYYRDRPHSDDGGYVATLVATVSAALAPLPTAARVAPVAQAAAARCAEAQILNHQAPRTGIEELRRWATSNASATGLAWQEYLAGATASVLAIGALIAAAADPGTTLQDAHAIDSLYLSIGALTMLDSVVDLDEDVAAGQLGYVQYYGDHDLFAERLAIVARDAVTRAREIPNGSHHIVTLAGIVAYYSSAPTTNNDFARSLIGPVRRELQPLITPTLALMRAWRWAKRMREWRARDAGEQGHSPREAPA
jgi:tetraprenyl-beta-curcumene synthase